MAVIASIEYVEVSITASTEPVTTNLTKGQDETQCTPFISTRNTATINDQHQDRCAEVTFIDNSGTPAVVVSASARVETDTTIYQIFVVEWDSSIVVQQIAVTGFTSGTKNVAITDVGSLNDVFYLYSFEFTDPPASDDDFRDVTVQTSAISTTSIQLRRTIAGGAVEGTCSPGTLYVVEANSAEWTVQAKSPNFTNTDSTTDYLIEETLSSTVDPVRTFLLGSYHTRYDNDDMEEGIANWDLKDGDTVRYRRGNTASGKSERCFAKILIVECNNEEWNVQRNGALTMSSATITDSITAIDQDISFVSHCSHASSIYSCGRNDSTNGNDIDDSQAACDFSADNTVRFRKRATALTDDIVSYEVIEFAAGVASGAITATAALAFSVGADLEGDGKLDATPTPHLVFSAAADLKAAGGAITASPAIVFAAATVNLDALGKLDASPSMTISAFSADLRPPCDQDLPPDAILVQTNLSGVVGDIDEPVDSPDANWLELV